ncbi:MAG: hypothetical protein AVDCRST_MAG58-2607 [uncultured Rubrobacteraceae bacterium]|uniref:Uncharacterized protein n=1 Tax=uncultured Rubrobacteraceae bacterium TaxID=349277 RepID=A0A6J4R3G6_9ACTN|nr:MAG: hypothetical protein AVDCRST_MAG58-2607 [uncultured Rubrobacteraceae bacterium]
MSAPLANLVVGFLGGCIAGALLRPFIADPQLACGEHAYYTGFNLVEGQSAYALA